MISLIYRYRYRLIVIAIPLLLSVCSYAPHALKPNNKHAAINGAAHAVLVLNHGWHTGIVVPSVELNRKVPQLSQRFAQAKFYEIGWGDKGFYQAQEITSALTMRAIFWPTDAVLHIVAIDDPKTYFAQSEMRSVCMRVDALDNLLEFIRSSFVFESTTDSARSGLQALKPGIYGDSHFYAAVGDYHLFNTCNSWTAKALASADEDISAYFKLTAASIMDNIDNRPCQSGDK